MLDFIEKVIKNKVETKEKDILNFVQPNALATDNIIELMDEYGLGNDKWKWVQFDELNCLANRSNCVLSVDKLKTKYGFDPMDEELAIHSSLNKIILDE